jgi:hypothetical protein
MKPELSGPHGDLTTDYWHLLRFRGLSARRLARCANRPWFPFFESLTDVSAPLVSLEERREGQRFGLLRRLRVGTSDE